MKKNKKLIAAALTVAAFSCLFAQSAFALTEEEVQNQVAAAGKAAVTGNLLIWFLCAIAFLKVSQKIDSFLSSLGLNVGHTGGSILAEAMIAARAIGGVKNFGSHSSSSRVQGGTSSNKFLSGGLVGAISQNITNNAAYAAVNAPNTSGRMGGGLGGALYSTSVQHGGSFANNVISTIAAGSVRDMGTLTGNRASEALYSYLGYAGTENGMTEAPDFSSIEIGGGRITGTETSDEHPDGISFGMYHAGQYAAPEGNYTTIQTADGTSWYKQYAVDAVNRTPYKAPDGSIAYNETIVQRMPRAPQRKERM